MRFVDEFKKFALRGNVVDLAVGVVIGTSFGAIVASLVQDLFMPVIGLLTGGLDVSGQAFVYRDARIGWGRFLQTLINFTIVGFCLFLAVKATNRLMHREEEKPPEPTATEKLLVEIRDLLARGAAPASGPGPTP